VGARARRVDARARPVQPRHDRGGRSASARRPAANTCIRARCCASSRRRCRPT
jgi:hypothetical protein